MSTDMRACNVLRSHDVCLGWYGLDLSATGLLDVEIAPLLRQQLLQTLGVDAAAGDGSSAGVDVGGGGGSAEEAKKKCSKQNQGQVRLCVTPLLRPSG